MAGAALCCECSCCVGASASAILPCMLNVRVNDTEAVGVRMLAQLATGRSAAFPGGDMCLLVMRAVRLALGVLATVRLLDNLRLTASPRITISRSSWARPDQLRGELAHPVRKRAGPLSGFRRTVV